MRLKSRRRAGTAGSVETLLERLEELSRERQTLRTGGAGSRALERNRREIVRAQWDLSRALIERYTAAPPRAA